MEKHEQQNKTLYFTQIKVFLKLLTCKILYPTFHLDLSIFWAQTFFLRQKSFSFLFYPEGLVRRKDCFPLLLLSLSVFAFHISFIFFLLSFLSFLKMPYLLKSRRKLSLEPKVLCSCFPLFLCLFRRSKKRAILSWNFILLSSVEQKIVH